MRQIDLKTLFWDSRSPADAFSYLKSAPMTNIGAYSPFWSSAVDDHFWVKTLLFSKKSRFDPKMASFHQYWSLEHS